MARTIRVALIASLVAAAWTEARADVRLSKLFTDNMMVQRDQPIRVWGLADPGEEVKVSLADSAGSPLAGQQAATKADADGRWKVELPALKSGENLTLTVAGKNPSPLPGSAAASTIVLKNVIVGDIWLCSGQSNMEMSLKPCLGAAEDIKGADFPKIRSFRVNPAPSYFPEEHVCATGPWQVCSAQTAGEITGVGFYFAREVHRKTGVPIGLLNSSVGGTVIEKWSSDGSRGDASALSKYVDAMEKWVISAREALKDGRLVASTARAKIVNLKQVFLPEGQPQPPEGSVSTVGLAEMEQWLSDARAALKTRQLVNVQGERLRAPPVIAFISPKDKPFPPWPWFGGPSGGGWYGTGYVHLYNGMIHPLIRLPIKGVLWYQGESNGIPRSDPAYAEKSRALIAGWRKAWGLGDFPFYMVQLARWGKPNPDPAGGDGWAGICVQQLKTLSVSNTGLAVIVDTDEGLHPANKYDVGLRLSRWALARDYGQKDLVVSGPLFKEMKVEGEKVRLLFDHVGTGLMIGKKEGRAPAAEDKAGKLQRFAIAGDDKKWVWATAVIDGNAVVVSSPEVKAPVAVRYAYAQNPEGANLYNREGLPASPFRTDDWQ